MSTQLTALEVIQITPPWNWPQNAGEIFLNVLRDRQADPAHRLVAAELAGDYTVVNDEICEVLLEILTDSSEPPELRERCPISFGAALEQADLSEFDDPNDVPISEDMFDRIQATLHEICRDASVPVSVRRRALEGSVRAPQDWHRVAIAEAYANGSRELVLSAVFCMRWIHGGFEKEILESLENPDPDIHLEAVQAAGANEIRAARAPIERLLKDRSTSKDLTLAAIAAVATVAPEDAFKLLEELSQSPDEDIAEAAMEAINMAEMGDEEPDDEDSEDDEPW